MSVDIRQPVFTIGHSNLEFGKFLALLMQHCIRAVADVRSSPYSQFNPQFNRETLPESLRRVGIDYLHLRELGGLRRPRQNSTNTGWRNLSFRGYADYMETQEFEKGLARLMDEANTRCVAVMCAEAVPWRCHRSLIGDALEARGVQVFEISSVTRAQRHKMTPFAQVEGEYVRYP